MTLSYTASATTAGVSWADGFINPNDNLVYGVENSTNTFRKYNLSTATQVGSNVTTLTGPSGICLLNSSSAVIPSSSNGTVDYIEVTSSYRQNVTGSGITASIAKSQSVAADTSLGIAFAVNNNNPTLTKITASPQAISSFTAPAWQNQTFSFRPNCIILKSAGRWLVGGTQGRVFEIDSNGNLIDEFQIGIGPSSGAWNSGSITGATGEGAAPAIVYMSYTDNMLLLGLSGIGLWLVDYTTKTRIWENTTYTSAGNFYPVLCQGASGETLVAYQNISNNYLSIQEVDCTISPVNVQGNLFINQTGNIPVVGMLSGTNLGFALGNNIGLQSFTVTPRSSTTRTVTVQNGGIDQPARLIILDDTGGTGTATRVLDTYMQSPATYRVPTGKSLIEIVKVGEGTTALWDLSRYST